MCKDHGLGSNCLMEAQSGPCFKYGKQRTRQLFWGGGVPATFVSWLKQCSPCGTHCGLPSGGGVTHVQAELLLEGARWLHVARYSVPGTLTFPNFER